MPIPTPLPDAAVQLLPVALVDEPPHRLRGEIDPERLGDLADSIAAEGLHQAIGVCGPGPTGRYVVGFGHRRLLAHRLLHRETIAARVYAPGTDLLLIAASENNNREQMSPMEEARMVQAFIARELPLSAIARLLRKSPAWVDTRRALMQLPPDVAGALETGELTIGVALKLAEIGHAGYRESLVAEAVRTGAKERTVDVWIAHWRADGARLELNDVTIQQMHEHRESYTVHIACESCAASVDIRATKLYRFCLRCAADIDSAIRESIPS